MSIGILEPVAQSSRRVSSSDWDTPAGVLELGAPPRIQPPEFTYRGLGDEHWRGQACYPTSELAGLIHERVVIMACGCQATVPWWTLEPLAK